MMENATPSKMREIIEQLIKKHGSVRKAAEAHNTYHKKLIDLRDKGTKDLELFDLLEEFRKDLKVSKAKMWDMVRGK